MDQKNRIFGYARVSSKEQNLDRQLLALSQYVEKENIITDKESGKDLDRRGYQALKGALGLRKGDILYIKSLDRLSRSKEDIKTELTWFKNQGIRLIVLDLPTTAIEVPKGQEWIIEMVNNILIEVLSSMAQQERETIRKRQREGIDAAKKRGKYLGRPTVKKPENFDAVIKRWRNGKITAREAMRETELKKSSFYRLASKLGNEVIR
jgi:DNA invertase Pin-like site-specific DNA recombinase